MYKVGSARINENNKALGGKPGDQTGKEVCEQPFYIHEKGWYGFAPISSEHGRRLAQVMRDLCNNPRVGYSQDLKERLGVFQWVSVGRRIKDIKEDTSCDCSSSIRACAFEATGRDLGNFSTADEAKVLEASGLFRPKIEIKDESQLTLGMILVTKMKGHTVIVTEVDKAPNNIHSDSDEKECVVISNEAVIKDGPSDIRKVIAIANKGDKLIVKGFHTNKWVLVTYSKNGNVYNGYTLQSNLR